MHASMLNSGPHFLVVLCGSSGNCLHSSSVLWLLRGCLRSSSVLWLPPGLLAFRITHTIEILMFCCCFGCHQWWVQPAWPTMTLDPRPWMNVTVQALDWPRGGTAAWPFTLDPWHYKNASRHQSAESFAIDWSNKCQSTENESVDWPWTNPHNRQSTENDSVDWPPGGKFNKTRFV